jgi:heptosyltransferase III
MKILVLQLARLGDIYTTWPTIRALRKKYPESEITLLVRRKFVAACDGLIELSGVLCLEADHLLQPLLNESVDIGESLARLDHWISGIKNLKFDKIINLTFSPASSYLTHLLKSENTEVRGYSRHSDSSLDLSDSISAYFYSQAGIHRENKVHTADLLAAVSEVELESDDWRKPFIAEFPGITRPCLAVHIGASQEGKSCTAEFWASVLNSLISWWKGQIFLLGAAGEIAKSDEILWQVQSEKVVSLVGKTELRDLFSIINQSEILVGCDSSPVHIASLTGTPTLNLSFSTVNFWETGPRANRSVVLWSESPGALDPATVNEEVQLMAAGLPTANGAVTSAGPLRAFKINSWNRDEFQWTFIKYIYFGGAKPESVPDEVLMAFEKLKQVNDLAIEQIALLAANSKNTTASQILDRADEMLNVVAQLVPDVGPIVRWLQTEKSRIPPGTFSSILSQTRNTHLTFARLLSGNETKEAHP